MKSIVVWINDWALLKSVRGKRWQGSCIPGNLDKKADLVISKLATLARSDSEDKPRADYRGSHALNMSETSYRLRSGR